MILLNDGVTLLLAIAESYVSTVLQFDLKRFVGEDVLQFLQRISNPADTCPGWKSKNTIKQLSYCEGPHRLAGQKTPTFFNVTKLAKK